MVPLALQLRDEIDGNYVLLDASDAEVCEVTTGEHGFMQLTCFVRLPETEAFTIHDQAPGKFISLNFGAGAAWEGRVEDRAIVTGGLRLTAFGAWRALTDVPYTALWSDPAIMSNVIEATYVASERYEMDTNARVYLAPKKNNSFSNAVLGRYFYIIPHQSSRQIVGIQFNYKMVGPSPWRAEVRDGGFNILFALTGTGSTQLGCVNITLSATDTLYFQMFLNSGTPATYAGETGSTHIEFTNIRVVTSTANRVNTTTTTTISAGSKVVTPVSMTNIYVGQRLFIDQGLSPSESVVVTAVTSTTFTATFVNGYTGTTTIHAHVVYADEIVKDLVSHVAAVNPDQLSSSTALIESPGLDLLGEVYEDQYPADIAARLASLGDNQSPPRRWEVGVWESQLLYFRPRGSSDREWFVDADAFDVDSTLETLVNSAYGMYQDANGRTFRTVVANDEESQDRYDIVRRVAVSSNTTSAVQAGVHRDTVVADGAVIKPRSVLLPDYIMDGADGIYPKWMCRAGDTVVVRNLPPTLSQDIERIRSFRVKETRYNWIDDTFEVVPEEPPATLDFIVTRQAEGFY